MTRRWGRGLFVGLVACALAALGLAREYPSDDMGRDVVGQDYDEVIE
jgi:hypothetical protein